MPLYLVVNDDMNGDNQDLFVNADTPDEAVAMMVEYYERELDEFEEDFRVFPVPMIGRTDMLEKGPIDWPEPIVIAV